MCVFCKIVKKEIPCYSVYEDNNVLAFLDISQATIGHTLIIPKIHFDNIFELDQNIAKNIFEITIKLAKAIKKATNADGINILNNNGEAAGQSINHFHIHIIPRYKNDNLVIKFSENNLTKEDFIKLKNQIIQDI